MPGIVDGVMGDAAKAMDDLERDHIQERHDEEQWRRVDADQRIEDEREFFDGDNDHEHA
jgi:hypothetical protein